jgi:hypothetical protein
LYQLKPDVTVNSKNITVTSFWNETIADSAELSVE